MPFGTDHGFRAVLLGFKEENVVCPLYTIYKKAISLITMSASNVEKEFVSYVVELMQSIGPVHAKGMFGGHGIFLGELMFGLVADNILYLKVDDETVDEFIEKKLESFTYNKKGKELKMSYYQAPEEILEEREEMDVWANKAYSAALRAASKKRNK